MPAELLDSKRCSGSFLRLGNIFINHCLVNEALRYRENTFDPEKKKKKKKDSWKAQLVGILHRVPCWKSRSWNSVFRQNVQRATVQPFANETRTVGTGLWMTHHQCVTIRRWTIVTCTAKCLTVSRLNPIRVFLSTFLFNSYESFLWPRHRYVEYTLVKGPSLFKIFGKWQWTKISGSLCNRWR